MTRYLKRWPTLLALLGLGVLGAAPEARAQFAVQLVSGAMTVTVMDGGPGDLNPLPGRITAFQDFGGIIVNAAAAVTNSPGADGLARLDLSYNVDAQGRAGGSVQITTSATGYTNPGPAFNPLTLTSAIGGTNDNPSPFTLAAQQWVNLDNTLFGTSGPSPGVQGPFGPGAFSNTASTNFNATGTYSITDRVVVNLNPNGIATGDLLSTVRGVPGPGGLALALCALPLVGGYLARRRLKKA